MVRSAGSSTIQIVGLTGLPIGLREHIHHPISHPANYAIRISGEDLAIIEQLRKEIVKVIQDLKIVGRFVVHLNRLL
jgi:hypothetical protein